MIEKANRALKEAEENNAKFIGGELVKNAMIKDYNNFDKCINEWRARRDRHKILISSLYQAIEMCRDNIGNDVELINVNEFYPEEAIPEYNIGAQRIDLSIKPARIEGFLIGEVELTPPIYRKYAGRAGLISGGDYQGMVIISTDPLILAKAQRTAAKTFREKGIELKKLKTVAIEIHPLRLGRLLAFATLTPNLNFPSDPIVRSELRKNVTKEKAQRILNHCGVSEKIYDFIF